MNRLILALLLGWASGCAGQQAAEPPRAEHPASAPRIPGSIENALPPPHILLAHSGELQLTSAQSTEILERTNATRAELARLDSDLDRVTESLRVALTASPIDEEAALHAAREVSAVEDEIKLTHLRMLIRVQNTLTAAQRSQAQAYRAP